MSKILYLSVFRSDLCIRHKMAFAREHRLYTRNKLRLHKREGDTNGFTGHPQCEFCHTNFYSSDELFTHCREKHEQCFICIRNRTGDQVYFKNYMKLVRQTLVSITYHVILFECV